MVSTDGSGNAGRVINFFDAAIQVQARTKKSNLRPELGTDPATILGLEFIKAANAADAATMERLIAQDVNVNFQNEEGLAALHVVAAMGARACIRVLVKSGKCDYLVRDNKGRYADELAIEWARDYAVARLIAKKQCKQAYERGVPVLLPPKFNR